MDRQNQARELEMISSRLEEVETEKRMLVSELNRMRNRIATAESGPGAQHESELLQTKSDPLILGVDVGKGSNAHLGRKEGVFHEGANTHQAASHVNGEGSSGGGSADQGNGQGQQDDVPMSTTVDPSLPVDQKELAEERRQSVVDGMVHAWSSYVKHAWGHDELAPLAKAGVDHFAGLGASIIDSLDTLYIMGLEEEFKAARDWVAQNLEFNKNTGVSVFETTIRVLGGLLSSYDLSDDPMFLEKAKDLGDRLLFAFNTPSGIPWNGLNLATGQGDSPGWTGGNTVLADLGTTQMEMIALTQRTGNPIYAEKSEHVIDVLARSYPEDGLLSIYYSPQTGMPAGSQVTFGAMGDSFYEYLVKVWVLGGKTPTVQRYRDLWLKSMKGLITLVRRTEPTDLSQPRLTYVAERNGGLLVPKMGHLLCFLPGMLLLGAKDSPDQVILEELAKEIGHTCFEFYNSTQCGLSGEDYVFSPVSMQVNTAYNIGRPETVEALMYLWRYTKDPIYREWGWKIWQNIEKWCKVEDAGYTGLRDVSQFPPEKDNMMQSFFLAETLKYLYLLFSPDDVMPLDQWVFNTEAHPLKIKPRNAPFGPSNAEQEGDEADGQARRL